MADQLTRILSLALRHKPELFGITVDSQGWTDLRSLIAGLRAHLPTVTEASVQEFIEGQVIERFESQGDRVRALYGHSLQHVAVGEQATPPDVLYHSTQAILLPRIVAAGLQAKGRNGVHLTPSWDYALSVRNTHTRQGHRGIILAVRRDDTAFKGIVFYRATEHVWLSPYIPACFLSIVPLAPDVQPSLPPRTFVPLDNTDSRAILRARMDQLLSE
jgi:putative RNA 2'-phosphotransferase